MVIITYYCSPLVRSIRRYSLDSKPENDTSKHGQWPAINLCVSLAQHQCECVVIKNTHKFSPHLAALPPPHPARLSSAYQKFPLQWRVLSSPVSALLTPIKPQDSQRASRGPTSSESDSQQIQTLVSSLDRLSLQLFIHVFHPRIRLQDPSIL